MLIDSPTISACSVDALNIDTLFSSSDWTLLSHISEFSSCGIISLKFVLSHSALCKIGTFFTIVASPNFLCFCLSSHNCFHVFMVLHIHFSQFHVEYYIFCVAILWYNNCHAFSLQIDFYCMMWLRSGSMYHVMCPWCMNVTHNLACVTFLLVSIQALHQQH